MKVQKKRYTNFHKFRETQQNNKLNTNLDVLTILLQWLTNDFTLLHYNKIFIFFFNIVIIKSRVTSTSLYDYLSKSIKQASGQRIDVRNYILSEYGPLITIYIYLNLCTNNDVDK